MDLHLFFPVADEAHQLVYGFDRHDKAKIEITAVLVVVVDLRFCGTLGKAEAVTGHQHQPVALHVKITAVEDGAALIVGSHGVHDLAQHRAQRPLGQREPTLALQHRKIREILALQGAHFMREFTAFHRGAKLGVDRKGHFSLAHHAQGLQKLLCVDDIGAFFIYLCLHVHAHAFFQVVGGHGANVGVLGLDQDPLCGGKGGFPGRGTGQRCGCREKLLAVECDFHKKLLFSPYLF